MKLPIIAILCGTLALGLVAVANADSGSAVAVEVQQGAGSASAPAPADSLANPIDDPVEAYSDLKAAKKQGWAFAIIAGIVMLCAAIGRAAVKWPTWPVLNWINKHKKALIVVGGAGVTATAAFNALALGGSPFAIAAAAGAALLAFVQSAPSEPKAE